MPRKPTPQQALKALETLREYGRNRYREEVQHEVTLGACLGQSLGAFIDSGTEILQAAGEALEDQNNHLTAAIVREIAKQRIPLRQDGERRFVVIELPSYVG